MKYCKNCNKVFTDEKMYCNTCGSKLEDAITSDIFGEPLNDNQIKSDIKTKTIIKANDYYQTLNDKKDEILTIISFLVSLFPVYGTAFIIFVVVRNFNNYNLGKTKKSLLILSIVALVISIIWFILLIAFKVIDLGYSVDSGESSSTENM